MHNLFLIFELLVVLITTFLGVIVAHGIYALWLYSDAVVLVTKLLRWSGLTEWMRVHNWPDKFDYDFWYRLSWEKWVQQSALLESNKFGYLVFKILSCPQCFSLHASWLAGVLVCLCSGTPPVAIIYTAAIGPLFILRVFKS